LKKPVIIWNNQNFTIYPSGIKMPFVVDGKSKKIEIMADISEYERSCLKNARKFGEYPQTDKKKS
jgi:putative transposase